MLRQNLISNHVVQFCRFLRNHQYTLGPQEEIQALFALSIIPYDKAEYFKAGLRATLVKSKKQLDRFDDLYLQYWTEVQQAENSKEKEVLEEKPQEGKQNKAPSLQVLKNWLYGNKQLEEIEIASFDSGEVFTDQDFSQFANDDLSLAVRYGNLLVKKLSNKKSRRFVRSKRSQLIDLKKVIGNNIGKSDEIIHLKYKKKKIEKLKLVLICDVSRSMELYSKFLIQFMYGLNRASTKIETFVFSTQLERITQSLQYNDFKDVLEELKGSFNQWSGGTKIGSSLEQFNHSFADSLLDQKTKVIILSDGWDTDMPEIVELAIQKIKRKSSKVIWLNPLAGNPNFKPETQCLKAALPYVDIFQAANSIESLGALVEKLSKN